MTNTIKTNVSEFLDKTNIYAVIGVSENESKYGHKVYVDLKKSGYKVYPINPKLKEILGDKCYSKLKELPEKPDVVNIVVPSDITEKIVLECKELGINKVWMQPGSESEKAITFCEENNIKVIHDMCIMISR